MKTEDGRPPKAARTEAHAHYAAAFIGGFLGLYPIVSVAHILGSAQTANIIEMIVAALAGDLRTVAIHALGVVLYCAGIFLATVIPKRTRLNPKLAAMAIDAAAAAVMWRLPETLNPAFYLYPTFFALAFHWCAFRGGYGFVSSAIFSTNNLRMLVSSAAEIVVNGDRSFALKAKFFGATLLAYHAGIASSWICWRTFGSAGFLLSTVPILVCAWLSERGRRAAG